ncbi:MAG: hypothetical protein C5B50_15955 [Verrucomicrobia bacterium]|nr:MAG: hypothetical protein C5B50_15955 [Verrucomicrobiota bacterium]
MKPTHSQTHRFARTSSFALLLGGLLLLALLPSAWGQTWTLTPAWTVANGVGHLANNNANRGIAYNAISNQVFVATRSGATTGAIDVFDNNGNLLSGAGGVTGANLGIDQIGVGDDGTLYGMPLITSVATGTPVTVYSWTNWNTNPYQAYASTNASDAVVTSFGTKRIGDSMAVRGSGLNTLILAGVASGGNNFVLLHTTDGVNFTSTVITNITGLPSIGGNIFGITFYTNNTFLVLPGSGASSRNVFLVSYPANFASQAGVTGTLLGNAVASGFNSQTYFLDYSPAGQMLAVAETASLNPNSVGIFGTASFPTSTSLLASNSIATANANGNDTGGAALGGQGKTNALYVLESNNGLGAYTIGFTAGPVGPNIVSSPASVTAAFPPQTLTVSATGTAPLFYYWQATNAAVAGSFTNIPSAANTNFFTISAATTNYYRVIVSNVVNAVTSSVAFVSLLTPTTNSAVSQLWNAGIGAYSFLANDNNTRGIAYDTNLNRLVVTSMSGGAGLYILNGDNGNSLGTLSTAGMYAGGTFTVDQAGIADDGAVYVGNLAVAGQTFALTRFPAATNTASGTSAYSGDPGNGSAERWGDSMAVRGSGIGTQILLGSYSGTNVVLLTTSDGINFSPSLIAISNAAPGFARNGIAFGAGNTLWGKQYASGNDLYQIAFDPVGLTGGVVFDYTSGSQIPSTMTGLGIDPAHNIMAGVIIADRNNDLQLFQLTGNANPPVLFNQAFFPSFNANGNDNAAVAMKFPRVYGLDVNNGIVALTYGVPASVKPTINTPPVGGTIYTNYPGFVFSVGVSGTLPLNYQWRFNSNNIPSASSATYTLHYPPTTASGFYDVIVTNFGGSVTSAPAQLTVITPVVNPGVTQVWTLASGSRSYLDNSSYNTRGLGYDTNTDTLVVADHFNIYVLAATNGQDLFQLNTLGLPNGGVNGWTLDQVGVADDGIVYGANLVTAGTGFSIVSWPMVAPNQVPTVQAYGPGDPGNGSNDRWGDTMAIRGSGTGTQILCGSGGNSNVVLFTTTDGQTFTPNLITVSGVPNGFSSGGVAFGSGNTFWAKGGPGFNLRLVQFDTSTGTGAVTLLYTAGTQIPNTLTGLGTDLANNLLSGVCFDDAPNDVQLYQPSGGAAPPALANQTFFGSANVNGQYNAVTILKNNRGFGLDVNNGLVAFRYGSILAPFQITAVTHAGSSTTITWNSVASHNYQVQFKNNATDTSWSNLGAPTNATTSSTSVTDTGASGAKRYYRVQGN